MKNLKQHILEKLKVTKSEPMELTFEQLRKAMLDCKERNKISNKFSVPLNTEEFKKNPLYTKIDHKRPIKSIIYREDEYEKDSGWLKLLLHDDPSNYNNRSIIEIVDNQDLHKFLSDETIERIFNYLGTIYNITEKLKVKHNISKMTLTEFNETRKSLNRKENNFKLVSQYDMKDMFINWVEQMLIEDGVIDEIPFTNYMKHIIRFDGDILIDNIVDSEIDPPVSTELYLTWGEAYMRVVTYYVKYDVFDDDCNLIYEKLKVSTNTNENDSTEVLFGKFIAYLANKPGKEYKNVVPEDLFHGLQFGPIDEIYLQKYFKNSWNELYNFFGKYTDDIVEISYRYDIKKTGNIDIYYCWEVGDKYFEDGPYESTLEELAKTTKFKDIKNAINGFIVNL